MCFFWDNTHSTIATAHHTLATVSSSIEARCGTHFFAAFFSFDFFNLFEAKYVLCKIISLDILRESSLEVFISNQEVKAFFHFLLSHVFTFFSKQSQKIISIESTTFA